MQTRHKNAFVTALTVSTINYQERALHATTGLLVSVAQNYVSPREDVHVTRRVRLFAFIMRTKANNSKICTCAYI